MVTPASSIDRLPAETYNAWVARIAQTPVTPEPTPTPEATPEPTPDTGNPPPLFDQLDAFDHAQHSAAVLDRLDAALVLGLFGLVVVILLVALHVIRHI